MIVAASGDLVSTVERLARDGPSLSVTADLSVSIDGIDITVGTVDDRIRVQLPSLGAGVRLLRSEHDRLPALSRVLSEADLTAEIRVGTTVIAVAGREAAPGLLSELLSLDRIEVRPRALIHAFVRYA